jgi:hypothetical protein
MRRFKRRNLFGKRNQKAEAMSGVAWHNSVYKNAVSSVAVTFVDNENMVEGRP